MAATLPAPIARLVEYGLPGGPGERETLLLLRGARISPFEGVALDHLVARASVARLPDGLALAVASALVDRGDREAARRILAPTTDKNGLLLLADLRADDGDLAGAIATVERALSRDLDLPGGRERRLAWRARLGLVEPVAAVGANETVAAPRGRGPFDLLREVGRGGAGVVYEARDRALQRHVALKIYHRPERDRAQLLHEARVAVALEGPGIVRVFDIQPDEGWLALEWAPLGALRDHLAVPLVRVGDSLAALTHALATVHASGWVHNDVKPANVLLAPGPEPWLGDFGNARRIGEPAPFGSFGYVSKERLQGRPSDPKDDVYALGRVIEDVLANVDGLPAHDAWTAIATRCVGDDALRPTDAAAVLAIIAGG